MRRAALLRIAALSVALQSAAPAADAPRFYRGMIHSHTCWSDGRALPEQAVAAYRDGGYDFFAITDHNRACVGTNRWIEVAPPQVGVWPPKTLEPSVFEAYRAAFPDAEWRERDGKTEVRMRPFSEVAPRFNEPGRFLVMPGCEVTTAVYDETDGLRRDIHMNIVGLDEEIPRAAKSYVIEWVHDSTITKTLRETKDEYDALVAARGNPPSVFFVNHPHWQYYDVLPQDIIDHPDIRFFEVCNTGGEWAAVDPLPKDGLSNDRLWDVVNATRCLRGEQLLYGLGTEDTHYYPGSGTSHSFFIGDAWIGVRADALTPAALFSAMERGDFYAAGGFDLEDVSFDAETGTLSVAVPAKPGVAYTVKFITTKRGVGVEPVRIVDIPASPPRLERHVPVYSPEIGAVAKEVAFAKGEAVRASYALAPDDLYVRARVESDEPAVYPNPDRHLHPLVKMAWTQPYRRDSPSVGAARAEAAPFQARYTPDVAARPQVRGAMFSQFTVSEDDFRTLKEWGATVARYQMYPVGDQWKGKTGTPEGFAAWLDWKLGVLTGEVLPLARKYGIPLVIDLHVPPGGRGGSGMKMLDDPEWADFFVECWRKIASACSPAVQTAPGSAPSCAPAVQTAGIWAYDLVNEPTQFSAPKHCDYLELQRRAAEAIRAIDPVTPIVVSCNADGAWCAPSAFRTMRPLDLVNILYQFHMYEPFAYTHQNVLPQFKDVVAAYPDTANGWNADWLRSAVEPVREFQLRHGARIFVGEFSAVAWAEGCGRWIADVAALLNGYGWDWCYHAFREWPGWSVEHEALGSADSSAQNFRPSADNPRKRALLDGLAK
ncbi:MAG: cellulase family glycosylhydrolase [Kiritimatiellae bacterium]|nr:cellulase family glycosylhydrolase [Kiritimatiellia bacterium]